MTVKDLKLDTKDDEGGESETQKREKRLLAKDQKTAAEKARSEKRSLLMPATKPHFKRRQERRNS